MVRHMPGAWQRPNFRYTFDIVLLACDGGNTLDTMQVSTWAQSRSVQGWSLPCNPLLQSKRKAVIFRATQVIDASVMSSSGGTQAAVCHCERHAAAPATVVDASSSSEAHGMRSRLELVA